MGSRRGPKGIGATREGKDGRLPGPEDGTLNCGRRGQEWATGRGRGRDETRANQSFFPNLQRRKEEATGLDRTSTRCSLALGPHRSDAKLGGGLLGLFIYEKDVRRGEIDALKWLSLDRVRTCQIYSFA